MKIVLVFFLTLLTACTTLDGLIAEAKICDVEQRSDCWINVNKKLKVIAERKEERETTKCLEGTVEQCDVWGSRRWCRCIRMPL